MKKYLFSAVAMFALVACNKETAVTSSIANGKDALVNNEIAINTAAQKTKGYITGTTFFDAAIAELHKETPATTERQMKLSAYLTPQSGDAGNYFVDYTFAKNGTDWHHTPAVYWPIKGELDFLAYSAQQSFDAKDVNWNEKNTSESVVLNVLEDRTQDDIVFAYAYDKTSADGASPVSMEFQHTQAWLEFQIKVASEDMKEKIAIKEIVIENANNSGELTIAKDATGAKAEWSFRHEQKKNIVFDDNYNLYGSSAGGVLTNALDEEISYMDMLLPEQAKTSFVIKYYLAGQDKELQYRYDLAGTGTSDTWSMGNKYIYAITFTVNEITIAPTVTAYENGDVATLFPSELK